MFDFSLSLNFSYLFPELLAIFHNGEEELPEKWGEQLKWPDDEMHPELHWYPSAVMGQRLLGIFYYVKGAWNIQLWARL